MKKISKFSDLSESDLDKLYRRSEIDISSIQDSVRQIIDEVRTDGDKAVKKYCLKFDKAPLKSLKASEAEFTEAEKSLPDNIKKAIQHAVSNVRKFHKNQVSKFMELIEIEPGVFAGEKAIPIQSVCLYVPRGRGNFPSMLYMLAVPAAIAGVPEINITTPADSEGKIDPACLYAAGLCGISSVFKASGPQAIAAFAFGTEGIPKVDKIIGPGSMYVSAAKRILSDIVDCGPPAGPSESLIYADDTADTVSLAYDFLVEAEHGSDSCVLLVTESVNLAEKAASEIIGLSEKLPEPRRQYVKDGLEKFGIAVVTADRQESIDFINNYAPEHLQIAVNSPFDVLDSIVNAAEIILGQVPFSEANYVIGANAILPTGGRARTWGPVSVRDFIKYSSVIYCTENGKKSLAGSTEIMAEYECFPAHAAAAVHRKNS